MHNLATSASLLRPLLPSLRLTACVHTARAGRIRESKKFVQFPNRDRRLPVFMLHTIEQHGLKGEIVWVKPTVVRQELLPNKQAIPARIYDPYLRGPRHRILEANRLGAMGDSMQTPEVRLAKAIIMVRKPLVDNVLSYTPDTNAFVIYPEDISVRYREEFELNIPRECIGYLGEEGMAWPITEAGEYSYTVRIDTGVIQDCKLKVLEPVILVDPKATRYD